MFNMCVYSKKKLCSMIYIEFFNSVLSNYYFLIVTQFYKHTKPTTQTYFILCSMFQFESLQSNLVVSQNHLVENSSDVMR